MLCRWAAAASSYFAGTGEIAADPASTEAKRIKATRVIIHPVPHFRNGPCLFRLWMRL